MIKLIDVTKSYAARAGAQLRALDHVSLSVEPGEWLAIMGPSGSGKSTLVNLLGCLDAPTAGKVILDGQDLAEVPASQRNRIRAEKIGFVFQQFHLIPYLSAVENVMLAQYFHSMTDEQEALEALTRVGLRERAHHLPSELSGGEQQRVCVARALINDPKIILADEPTGNLDAVNEGIVMNLLRELHSQGRTIVMVTHDTMVARMADRRIELQHGRIVSQQVFSLEEQQQFDEVLEEIWIAGENNEFAELGRLHVDGALPLSIAVEKMQSLGLVRLRPHSELQQHTHKDALNRCHELVHPDGAACGSHGHFALEFTERGRNRAEDVIRRHRLAERLFVETLHVENEAEIEQQACKFEHILSPEATDRICSFLGHPATCPHGSPIPAGQCCAEARTAGAHH
ncbi:MAG TPA: ATP-binding cassette domain-containing protein [Terriglobales bacterium]|nr:ATP-binding cassette domain-containing protein [Terriglobales bacterium]